MYKKYLLLPDGINRFGYAPRSGLFRGTVITAFGTLRKGGNDYCFIRCAASTELIRYDEKCKRWAALCFPNEKEAA